jgi:hypothetical protein
VRHKRFSRLTIQNACVHPMRVGSVGSACALGCSLPRYHPSGTSGLPLESTRHGGDAGFRPRWRLPPDLPCLAGSGCCPGLRVTAQGGKPAHCPCGQPLVDLPARLACCLPKGLSPPCTGKSQHIVLAGSRWWIPCSAGLSPQDICCHPGLCEAQPSLDRLTLYRQPSARLAPYSG